MEGGIRAWKGWVAKGIPEAGMTYFPPATTPEELMALAWLLEDGSRAFYAQISEELSDPETGDLFRKLTDDEKKHQKALLKIYREISGQEPEPEFPGSIISVEPREAFMEGGMRVLEALAWAKGKPQGDILEFSISLEVNSFDLYLKMERKTEDNRAKEVFKVLSAGEKSHLEWLTARFEKKLTPGE